MQQSETLSRREREKLWQRREMLNAAIELFSENGYHNVSMQEIAKKAEFAIGTLYKFFKNKEDLYRSIILEQSDIFDAEMTKALEGEADEMEKLRNYILVKGSVFRENAAVIRLYFAETRGASFNIKAGLEKEIRDKYELNLQNLAGVFAAGIEKKRFHKIASPYHLAVILDNISSSFLHLWLESPEQHPYPEDPDIILNILYKGLLVEP